MKNKIIITSLCMVLTVTMQSQFTYEWSAQFGGINTDYAYAIAVDNDGNVISGGEFRYTVDFDPSEDGEALLTAEPINNGYVSKLNADGEYLWAHLIEGTCRVLDIHTDNDGNVYAAGRFYDTIDVIPGPDEMLFTSHGQLDAFIIKYSPAGDVIWAFAIGGIYHDYFNNIAIDGQGNVLLGGTFSDVVDFDPGAGTYELDEVTDVNYTDAFVAKYTSAGDFVWARAFSGESLEEVSGVEVTSEGDIIASGFFAGLIDLDPGAGIQTHEDDFELDWQGFAVKLNDAGEFIWGKSFGGTGHDQVFGMAMDAQDKIYLTGKFGTTADLDPGDGAYELTAEGFYHDAFILTLDTDGNFVWAIQFAGPEDGAAYAIDVAGNTITTVGYAKGTCDFDPGAEVNTESSGAAGFYGFIAMHDMLGQYLWSDRLGNGADEFGYAVVSDETHSYATGTFKGTSVWFGNTFYNSEGLDDVYVAKILHSNPDQVINTDQTTIVAFPNPANDFITLTGLNGKTELTLTDITGKVVMRVNAVDNTTLDLSFLEEGVYILRSDDDDHSPSIRIVRTR